jgi:hypothetical protein
MKKKMCKIFVLLMMAGLHANAQTVGYRYDAKIASVDSSGFYNIVLTPELNGYLTADYRDLRVVNDSGKWVPHLVRTLNDEITRDAITWQRKIISNTTTASATEVIVEGSSTDISNISFALKNAVTDRYCTLTGSDDRNAWFVINDSIKIIATTTKGSNRSSFELLFPPVNYKYFKIKIYNYDKAPLNILGASSAGLVDEVNEQFKYFADIENPATSFIQKDSNKISYIKVVQSAACHFEKIALKLTGVKYYNRTAEVYIPNAANHSFSNPGQLIASFTVSNNSTLQLSLPVSNAKTFYILIHNDDNLSLKAAEIKTYIKYRVLSVYLEKSKQYRLLLSNEQATAAHYDLQLNNISIRQNLPIVNVGAVSAIPQAAVGKTSKDHSTQLIWLSIGVAAIVLAFFTYRLVADMNKKDARF